MKKVVLVCGMLLLGSCGGDGSGNGNSGIITNTSDSLKIVGDNQAQTFNKTTDASINIIGNTNVIVIKSNVSSLKITGNGNMLDITAGAFITSCKIIGNNNVLTKLTSQSVSCEVSGTDNTGF